MQIWAANCLFYYLRARDCDGALLQRVSMARLVGIILLHYCVWVWAMFYVGRAWAEALFTQWATEVPALTEQLLTRQSTNWDIAGLVYVFVMTHWRGSQSIMLFSIYVGMLSLHLAYSWPRIMFFQMYTRQSVHDCWTEWVTANLTALSEDQCDNQHITTNEFMHNFYYCITTGISVMFCVDMVTVVVVFNRNQNIPSPDDLVEHNAFCSRACTYYLFMDYLHSQHGVVWFRHTLNVIVFLVLFMQSFHKFYDDLKSKTSRNSLFAQRIVCVYVVCTEFVVLSYNERETFAYKVIDLTYFEVTRVYQFDFIFKLAAYIYSMVRPDTNIVFAGAW